MTYTPDEIKKIMQAVNSLPDDRKLNFLHYMMHYMLAASEGISFTNESQYFFDVANQFIQIEQNEN